MTKQTNENEKTLQPIELDKGQLQELDQLIDSLRKEIVFPKKKIERKIHEAKPAL
jgi:hypothetical protein